MDLKFSSNLQTALNLLGIDKSAFPQFAPPKSQDPADKLLHEFFIGATMAKIGKSRKDIACDMIFDMREEEVSALAADAVKLNSAQKGVIVSTEHYNANLQVNKPPQKVDLQQFCIQLVKLGVDMTVINKAMDLATSAGTPAKVLTVLPTHERS